MAEGEGHRANNGAKTTRATWPQRLGLIGVGLALLLLVEGVVRLVGLAPAYRPKDPLMSGLGGETAYEKRTDADGRAVWVCPWISDEYPANYPPVPVEKAPGELRFIVLGGSSAVGYPYDARTAFSGFLQAGLRALYPDRTVRVINCGQNNIPAGTCLKLMVDLRKLEPDGFIVYSGNNEYENRHVYRLVRRREGAVAAVQAAARHSALYRAVESLTLGAKHRVYTRFVVSEEGVRPPEYSPAERRLIADNYAYVVQRMVDFCREQDTGLLLCTVPANRADWPPYRSTFAEQTTAAARARWLREFRAAVAAMGRGEPEAALRIADRLAAVDAHRADLHFLRGSALERLERWNAAQAAFTRACDLDNVCYRARPSHNDILRRLAAEHGVPLSDNVAALRAAAPDGRLGLNFFWDHCHPTVNAHQAMAFQIARTLVAHGRLPRPKRGWEPAFVAALNAHAQSVTYSDVMHARAWRNTASGWLSLWTSHRSPDNLLRSTDAYIRRAMACLDRAIEHDPTLASAWFYRGVCHAQLDDIPRARADWKRALALEPERSRLAPILQDLLAGDIPPDRGFETWLYVRNEMKRLAGP